ELRDEQRAIHDEQRAIRGEQRALRESEQGEYRLAMEGRRLGEANVLTQATLQLISPGSGTGGAHPFLIFPMPVNNKGGGPVDCLASLASARLLSTAHLPGIGLRGRDVEWDDYETFYWDEQSAAKPFAGISTTKSMLARATHFIRLAPHERGSLRRID